LQIIDLPPNEKITKNGFYRMPIKVHHGQPCDGPSVTSSVLRNIEAGASPEDIWTYHALNPDALDRPDSDAMRTGRAMAALLEGGRETLEQEFMILREDRPPRPLESQIEAYKRGNPSDNAIHRIAYWSLVDNDPRSHLEQSEFELLVKMAERLANDPAAVMLQGEPEITMAWYHEELELWVLSRPDQLELSGMVTDYKKMSPGRGKWFNNYMVDRRIEDYEIHMQMSLAWEAMGVLTGHRPMAVGIVAQSDMPPYSVIARDFDKEILEIGQFQNHRAMRIFSEAYYSGNWWGPGQDVGCYNMRKAKFERLIEEMQTEGWPK